MSEFLKQVAGPQAVILLGTLIVTFITWTYNLRRQRRDAARARFAEALACVVAYVEFPFAIARRRHDEPAGERVRLSEAIREVQRNLSFHSAWLAMESPAVAAKYDAYVTAARRIAGTAMRDAWGAPAITEDQAMNFSEIAERLKGLQGPRREYLQAVWEHEHPLLGMLPGENGPAKQPRPQNV